MRALCRVLRGLAVTVALSARGAFPAAAQDVDAAAALRGLPLPAAYYEQVRTDPTAYQFSRALFARSAPARAAAAGSVRLPVVLALFADSPTPTITREMVQEALFDGPSPHGTLSDAYREMSRGALDVRGDVLPWVRTSWTVAQVVGASDGLGNDGKVGAYFREALDSLDGTVDFAVYDNDGPDGIPDSGDDDGFVDVVTFEYLEVAASCGGPAIWPHRWTLGARLGAPYRTDDLGASGDTIRVQDYITQGATDCTGTSVQGAGTLAHEFGHALGLADYYHWIDRAAGAQGRRWVLGCWELMAAGSWGCGPTTAPTGTFGPTHFTAPLKHELGWLDYVTVGEVWNEVIELEPVQTSGQALRIPMGSGGNEFLIAEYRPATGFDQQLPAGGVLFYKQDLTAARQPDPLSGAPYYLTLLERDANRGLLRMHAEGGNRGEAGDAWAVTGFDGGDLHALSLPALTLSDGTATPVVVHDVSVVNGRARLVVSTSPTPRLMARSGSPPGSLALRVAGGVMPYSITVGATAGTTSSVNGDDVALSIASGPFLDSDAVVSVRDAAGTMSVPVYFSASGATTWAPDPEGLAAFFTSGGTDPTAPTGAMADYLDQVGNANGAYDVGDLRRWLATHTP
ncbi:MAG: M6 family metalloprotease domain-containing protein [Longimicrobiales bacterium]